MDDWATRPPRLAAYALAACVGALVWLLLTAASAAADEGTRASAGGPDRGPTLADLRSAPSPLGQRGSATGSDPSASSHRPAAGPAVSPGRTVDAVADVATSGQREVSRTLDRVGDGVPAGDRAVTAVTGQLDRTTDAAVETVTDVARSVDVAVTDPLVRPEPGAQPGPTTDDPAPAAPEEPSAASAPRGVQAEEPTATVDRKPAGTRLRASADSEAPGSRSSLLPTPALDPAPLLALPEGPRTSGAPDIDDGPPAIPGKGAPDLGGDATAVSSADGGSGALAVLDARTAHLVASDADRPVPARPGPHGPSLGPGFSPD